MCGEVSGWVFNIFLFGVKKKNLFSVEVSIEFQTVSSDYSCKWPLLTHRHVTFQISFSAPVISSAVKKRLLNMIYTGVYTEVHSSKERAPPVQHADIETHLR